MNNRDLSVSHTLTVVRLIRRSSDFVRVWPTLNMICEEKMEETGQIPDESAKIEAHKFTVFLLVFVYYESIKRLFGRPDMNRREGEGLWGKNKIKNSVTPRYKRNHDLRNSAVLFFSSPDPFESTAESQQARGAHWDSISRHSCSVCVELKVRSKSEVEKKGR